jgi:hypothetical protein
VIRAAPRIGEPRESDGCIDCIERASAQERGGEDTLMPAPQFQARNEPEDQNRKQEAQPDGMNEQDQYPQLARVVDAPRQKMCKSIHLNSIAAFASDMSSVLRQIKATNLSAIARASTANIKGVNDE